MLNLFLALNIIKNIHVIRASKAIFSLLLTLEFEINWDSFFFDNFLYYNFYIFQN